MQSTSFFSEALDRLKQELQLSEDQEVAEVLGMSKAAFSARKARGSFPDKELVGVIARRPELGIDYDFVVTGVRGRQFEEAAKRAAQMPLTKPEERLLALIDQLRPESKIALLQTALRLRELEVLLAATKDK